MDLNSVFKQQLDLYELLDFRVKSPDDLVKLTAFQIKRKFRHQALKYHPDKNKGNPDAALRFHLVDEAAKLLSNSTAKKAYDSWYIGNFLKRRKADEHIELQRAKLHARERAASPKTQGTFDLATYEEYGHLLRKLKHFEVPYGDWRNFDKNPSSPKHKLQESSTLRLELSNNKILRNKDHLIDLLSEEFQATVFNLYYSSRNDYANDSFIVAYASFNNIQDTLRIVKTWNTNKSSNSTRGALWSHLEDISPKVDPSIFSFKHKTDLHPAIQQRLANEAVQID
ncbi:LAME_0G02410g1_1 [Lachancea meyersii CBS 8951]|uniref:LAME_0G02410g1_1 n=1 Tax=Lachancea meyersii CBS 8951 TaxID=1266667 RepID=A0A1G4K5X8_9SACH|nr:LAME_0G02410g1_1 [Lachancea meyersii CBS 8951]